MDELAQLRAEMLRGNQAKSQLAGLDEQFTRANSMRDAGMTAPNKYGYASPLQAVADIMKNSTGRRQARELAPQREAARQAIGASAGALPLYQAQQQLNKDAQAQDNYEATALARTVAAQKLADAKGDERSLATYIDAQTDETFTVGTAANGRSYLMDAEGNETAKDMSTLMPQSEYLAQQKAQVKADKTARYGGLSENQLGTRLSAMEKKIQPAEEVVRSIHDLDKLLNALEDPQNSIPGIGLIEGSDTTLAAGVRLLGSQEGRNINSAWNRVVAPLIRKQAGLAQTLTESARVARSFGTDTFNTEETFRKAYKDLKKAMAEDLKRIKSSQLKGVVAYYEDRMEEAGGESVFNQGDFSDPFAPREDMRSARQQEIAELEAQLAEQE